MSVGVPSILAAIGTKSKTLHDNNSEEPSEEPGVAGVAAALGKGGHVGQTGMAEHGGFVCTRRTVETITKERPEQNRTQRAKHPPHNVQKVDVKHERDIIHISDGGPMTETTVGIRFSDGVFTILSFHHTCRSPLCRRVLQSAWSR